MGRVAGEPDHADQRKPPAADEPAASRLPRLRDDEVPVRLRCSHTRRVRTAGEHASEEHAAAERKLGRLLTLGCLRLALFLLGGLERLGADWPDFLDPA